MPLQEGVDYYCNERGLMVLTASYLRQRGYCCGNGCVHCPYVPRHGGPHATLPRDPAATTTEQTP